MLNLIILILIFSNTNLEKMPRLSFVAATINQICDNPIEQINDVCKKLPFGDPRPGTKRTEAEEEIAECCSDDNGGDGPQEYCWGTTDPGYCIGTLCTCQIIQAQPLIEGESYGVAKSTECISTDKYSVGKCWYQIPEFVITPWNYNENLEPEPGLNVYVREEKVWFLDPRGYLVPAKVTVTVW